MSALPLGMVIGTIVVVRWRSPAAQERLMLPMSLAAPAVLALTAFDPAPAVAAVIWFFAGALSAMQVIANRVFVVGVAREVRGRAFGIAAAGIATAQGVGALLTGALAQHVGSATAIADLALPVFAAVAVISVRTFGSGLEINRGAAPAEPFDDTVDADAVTTRLTFDEEAFAGSAFGDAAYTDDPYPADATLNDAFSNGAVPPVRARP